MSTTPRRHGAQRPWDVLQIVAVLGFLLHVALFGAVLAPLLPPDVPRIVVATVELALFAVTAALYVMCTLSEPDDPRIHAAVTGLEGEDDDLRHCHLCDRYVHESTKHCMRCNKCIIGFDHHCRWLNCCIGVRNYRLFSVFIGTTFAVLVGFVAVGLYHCIRFGTDRHDFDAAVAGAFQTSSGAVQHALLVMIAVGTFLAAAGAVLLGQLVSLHLWLGLHGLTTYDHILAVRRQDHTELAERDAAGMPPACWHAACHTLAMRCWQAPARVQPSDDVRSPEAAGASYRTTGEATAPDTDDEELHTRQAQFSPQASPSAHAGIAMPAEDSPSRPAHSLALHTATVDGMPIPDDLAAKDFR